MGLSNGAVVLIQKCSIPVMSLILVGLMVPLSKNAEPVIIYNS